MPFPDPETRETMGRFEILGINRPAHFSLEDLFDEDGDRVFRASLAYSGLSASGQVWGLDPARFVAYFEDLAGHRGGWVGEKRVANLDGELSVGCEYQDTSQIPEVWFDVRLALDHSDPYWSARLRLVLRPEALRNLAERSASFFRTTG